MIVIVTMQSYVSKRCPKNIRGMIFAVIGIFAALGCVSYLQLYNYLSSGGKSWMAFGTIVIFDGVWLIVLTFFILIGKYGNPPACCDDEDDQAVLELRGPDAIPTEGKPDDNKMVRDIMADIERREQ